MILKKIRSFVERQVFLNETIYSKNTVAKNAFQSLAALEQKSLPGLRTKRHAPTELLSHAAGDVVFRFFL